MRAELYDAGTRLLKGNYGGGSLLDVQAKPGMQKGSFREIDMEYDFRDAATRIVQINKALREGDLRTELLPWPVPFPGRMWMDNTTRYEAAEGGPVLQAYHNDPYGGGYDLAPAGRTELVVVDRKEEVEREQARVSALPTTEAIQDRNPSPTEWLRLDLENEAGSSSTDLQRQQVMMHHTDKEGGRVTLSGGFNAITCPFDLREPTWYRVLDRDGAPIATEPEDVAKLLAFDPEGHYRLYLRPANWRWVYTVVAHYIYVSWFELFYTDQIFTQAYYQRPPVYPKRHDLLHAVPQFTVNGVPHSYDEAINLSWDYSRASKFLSHQIIDAQWYTMSEAFIFAGNDPGSLVITMYPPAANDIVLGVGRVDYPGGTEETLWVQQVTDVEAESGWAPTTLEVYYVPWFVTPQPPGL
jgi:hypothetical protein